MSEDFYSNPLRLGQPKKKGTHMNGFLWVLTAALVVMVIIGMLIGIPQYNVWRMQLAGEGALKYAEQQRQVLVQQAKAEAEAAVMRAQAIHTVGAAAKQYPEYRYQEFIGAFAEALHQGKISQIIYVPTEHSIPIVEAPQSRMTH